jgi:hypothetical protein
MSPASTPYDPLTYRHCEHVDSSLQNASAFAVAATNTNRGSNTC